MFSQTMLMESLPELPTISVNSTTVLDDDSFIQIDYTTNKINRSVDLKNWVELPDPPNKSRYKIEPLQDQSFILIFRDYSIASFDGQDWTEVKHNGNDLVYNQYVTNDQNIYIISDHNVLVSKDLGQSFDVIISEPQSDSLISIKVSDLHIHLQTENGDHLVYDHSYELIAQNRSFPKLVSKSGLILRVDYLANTNIGKYNFEILKSDNFGESYFPFLSHSDYSSRYQIKDDKIFFTNGSYDLLSKELLNGLNLVNSVDATDNYIYLSGSSSIRKISKSDLSDEELLISENIDAKNNQRIKQIEVSNDGIVYIQTFDFFLALKNNKWEFLNNQKPIQCFDIDSFGNIYMVANGELFKSVDQGNTFNFQNNGYERTTKIIHVEDDNLIANFYIPFPCLSWCATGYLGYLMGFKGSLDGGNSWTVNFHKDYNVGDPVFVTGLDIDEEFFLYSFNSSYQSLGETNAFLLYFDGYDVIEIEKNDLSYRKINYNNNQLCSGKCAFSPSGELFYNTCYFDGESFHTADHTITPIPISSLPRGLLFPSFDDSSIFVLEKQGTIQNLYSYDRKVDGLTNIIPVFRTPQSNDLLINQIYPMPNGKYYITTFNDGIFVSEGVQVHRNTIQGEFFADRSEDCIFQTAEENVAGSKIGVQGDFNFTHLLTGSKYDLKLPDGEWTITPIFNDTIWSSCTPEKIINLENGENVKNDIGLIADDYCSHFSMSVNSLRLRRCFDNKYFIKILNDGTSDAQDVKILVTVDPYFEEIRFDTPFTKVADHEYLLEIGQVDINTRITVVMDFTLSCEADLGTTHCINVENKTSPVCEVSQIFASEYTENIGAFDPNDIRVFNTKGYEDAIFDKDEYQHYKIRFQNTGTDTAFNIKLWNKIPNELDIETFEAIGSSHENTIKIDESGKLEVIYNNIMLPDSNINQLLSNGFFNYRIKPKKGIPHGTSIQNNANIFFDFNAPIATNTSTVLISPKCSKAPKLAEISHEICEGHLFEGYRYSGRYRDVFLAQDGCDSIRMLNLKVLPVYYRTDSIELCYGQWYNDRYHYYSNTISLYYKTAQGCDSIIRTYIDINPKIVKDTVDIKICEGDNFHEITNRGSYFLYLNSTDQNECLATLVNLDITSSVESQRAVEICMGDSYLGHNTEGIYTDTLTSINGCDSLDTYNLLVIDSPNTELERTICAGDSYESYYESGTYTDIFQSTNGCDSTRTVHLIVRDEIITHEEVEICPGEDYLGYTESGSYKNIYQGSTGCDSVHMINLIVFEEIHVSIEREICAGNSYEGYSHSGTYEDIFKSSQSCDSIRSLILVVLENSTSTIELEICEGENFDGHYQSGTYIEKIKNSVGCDSTIELHLKVLEPYETIEKVYLCPWERFENKKAPQILTTKTEGSHGCDSIIYTELVLINPEDIICVHKYDNDQKLINDTKYISVYPNPVMNEFTIDFKKENKLPVTLRIYDQLHKKFIEEQLTEPKSIINTISWASGIYLIHIQSGNNVFVGKVVK